MYTRWTIDMIETLENSYTTGGYRLAMKDLNLSKNSVQQKAYKLGISAPTDGRLAKTHGKRNHSLYFTWRNMIQRCTNPTKYEYHRYGGRGITVCDEWKDVNRFIKWAEENGYKRDLTLDRIDNNGNYEPSNCRWATRKEQSLNSTRPNLHTFGGITDSLRGWSIRQGIKYNTVVSRIHYGWSVHKALNIHLDD